MSAAEKLNASQTAATETIPLIKPDLPRLDEVREAFEEILSSGKITNFGKYVNQFETKASAYLGTEVATVSSGTMGLLFSLQALGVSPGDKVLLPSFSFMATAQAVLYAGAVPVFAEVETDMTISVEDVRQQLEADADITAVIGVHVYGLPARVHELQQVVESVSRQGRRKIALIYDGAHAFGSAIAGERMGRFGDAEVFSLSATKTLVSVEGGMISSRNGEFIRQIRHMRNYGIKENYNAHWPGLNGKMSEFHAVVGCWSIERLDELLAGREQRARAYREAIETNTGFRFVGRSGSFTHTYKDFTIWMPDHLAGKRDEIVEFLKQGGVETRAYFFPPIHEQVYFRKYCTRDLPRTAEYARRVLTLPFFTTLTDPQIHRVVELLAAAERKFGK